MNLISAIKRLSYTTSNSNKSNDKDVEALNIVIEWINREKETQVNQNRYFGKMVVNYYIELLQFYEWDNTITEKSIQEILDKPLEEHYERFRNAMNTKSYIDGANILGLNLEYINVGKTHDEKKLIADKNKIIMKENKEQLLKSVNPWTKEEINSKLNFFISELLNKYGNKP